MVFSLSGPEGLYLVDKGKPACLIHCLTPEAYGQWQSASSGPHLAWAETTNFSAAAGETLLMPNSAGGLDAVFLGLGARPDAMALAALPGVLPAGAYRLADTTPDEIVQMAALSWAMGCYRFDAYKSKRHEGAWPQLVLPKDQDAARIERLNAAVYMARDLINTPAADMGPEALQAAVQALADTHQAELEVIEGAALLDENYPLIHAVGRAAVQAPRVLDLRWGRADAPRVTLVGKGVCFDTGGLNLKPGSYMDLMKKDMGGAAIAIALAHALMASGLDIRLRLMVGAVENAIGPDAFRPGDILQSRKGLSVEIGNTDAEGRLVLADLLAEADGEEPAFMIDFATLTGAARVAIGPEIVPFYTHDDGLAADIQNLSHEIYDPMWRMPLWPGYDGWLDSQIADVNHISSSPMAGSITAALFLSRFVETTTHWMHCDVYAWVVKPRAGRPVGGEAQALRSIYTYLEERFG
jgi:leucyl aminopeptidase